MLKKSKLSAELMEASKAQNSINVQLHKVRTSRINRSRVRRRDRRHQLEGLPLDFLAIGDSWFEYPIYDNGPIPGETGIVAQTQRGHLGGLTKYTHISLGLLRWQRNFFLRCGINLRAESDWSEDKRRRTVFRRTPSMWFC